MVNEITNPCIDPEMLPTSPNGKFDPKAVGYITLGVTVLGIIAMFKGYSFNFGSLSLSSAA